MLGRREVNLEDKLISIKVAEYIVGRKKSIASTRRSSSMQEHFTLILFGNKLFNFANVTNSTNVTSITNVKKITRVSNITNATNITNVTRITNITDITNIIKKYCKNEPLTA
jgi:hypothetical protein